MISCIFWKSTCMLYKILTKIYHIQYIYFNINCALSYCIIILSLFSKAQQYWNTNIETIVYKTIIQTALYLFSLCWFPLWINVRNGILNIIKLSIHSVLIFIWKTNNIHWLFHQSKSFFVFGIIYPTSSNTYIMIDITSGVNQLNYCCMVTDVIKISNYPLVFHWTRSKWRRCSPLVLTRYVIILFANLIPTAKPNYS